MSKPKTVIRPLQVRYAVPPPKSVLCWLETAHFIPPEGETVLLAWPRKEGFTFRTGRFNGGKWRLSCNTEPHEKPVFFAFLNSPT